MAFWMGEVEQRWPVGGFLLLSRPYRSNQTVWSSSSTFNVQNQTCRNKGIRTKSGCKLRKYEKQRLQYDRIQTEETEYRIEEMLRSLVAPLPRCQRIK